MGHFKDSVSDLDEGELELLFESLERRRATTVGIGPRRRYVVRDSAVDRVWPGNIWYPPQRAPRGVEVQGGTGWAQELRDGLPGTAFSHSSLEVFLESYGLSIEDLLADSTKDDELDVDGGPNADDDDIPF